ncbi:FAD-binding oxidoreductase [Polyangium aurulentum]|uniref:FAD-binding oxidoreductase n=1 Tax=Polyangium aurulentum TaxID=2567896 RepID=UPI0010AE7706|nr:FAD-binding oxidoreductase [Polyangium aurulentum]UQA62550.1 FAD-binding oxidoreductase [Polyangium aurulentum]
MDCSSAAGTRPLAEAAIAPFAASLRGALLRPGEPGYDDARHLYNAMIDRRPALIARCAGPEDVAAGVAFAREHGLLLAIKGGGHNVAGSALCDGGLVLDLSGMRAVRVDPEARTARAEGGATWGDFDRATQAHGLATTGGAISSTGIAGLTLGGGLGMLMRKHGLTCDNLVAADVVLADGRRVRASESEEPDLFWALRGGGGNFGAVTAFEYRIHPRGPVLAGSVFYPFEKARQFLRIYRDLTANAPDDLTLYAILLHTPDGAPAMGLQICHAGEHDEGRRLLRPLDELGAPIAGGFGPTPYVEMQCSLDRAFPPGLLNYWKSNFLRALSDDAIDDLIDRFRAVPSPLPIIMLEHLGGAVARVPHGATAFCHRDTPYNLFIVSRWTDPAVTGAHVAWARDLWRAMERFSAGGVYVNYLGEGESARVPSAYGPSYARLADLKRRYDPTNLFRVNQNVSPAKAA